MPGDAALIAPKINFLLAIQQVHGVFSGAIYCLFIGAWGSSLNFILVRT